MKLFSLVDSNATPKLIGLCKCTKVNTYAKLRLLLEGIHIVDCPSKSFDVESICMISSKLDGLNRVSSYVYVLPLAKPNLEIKKRMCVVDLDFFLTPIKL